jgi:SAM-dependent methyltransferase
MHCHFLGQHHKRFVAGLTVAISSPGAAAARVAILDSKRRRDEFSPPPGRRTVINTNNIVGHRKRFEDLNARNPKEATNLFVGGGDPIHIGYREKELILRHHSLKGAYVVDLGCGIGRLTQYVAKEAVSGYLGTDIVPEILARARESAGGRQDFRFEIVEECKIPLEDERASIVCGFSLITHLLDEEVFAYFREARRVMKTGGTAVFSFLDFVRDRAKFVQFASNRGRRFDVLKYFEKSTLTMFADENGFDVVEFIDGGADVPAREKGTLLDGRPSPKSISLGQSVIFMRAR